MVLEHPDAVRVCLGTIFSRLGLVFCHMKDPSESQKRHNIIRYVSFVKRDVLVCWNGSRASWSGLGPSEDGLWAVLGRLGMVLERSLGRLVDSKSHVGMPIRPCPPSAMPHWVDFVFGPPKLMKLFTSE